MKITKNKTDILYQVLLKHFDVDKFLICQSTFRNRNVYIKVVKNGYQRTLTSGYTINHITFPWATKYFFYNLHRCNRMSGISGDIEVLNKLIPELKYEFVKRLFQVLKRYHIINVTRPMDYSSCDNMYSVRKINNLEQMIIEEELRN